MSEIPKRYTIQEIIGMGQNLRITGSTKVTTSNGSCAIDFEVVLDPGLLHEKVIVENDLNPSLTNERNLIPDLVTNQLASSLPDGTIISPPTLYRIDPTNENPTFTPLD
ncbi:hypothetical protein GF389_05030 [Candidatus Dojkabacteria bacterium]|nr:hypothetical protein [Candidatus Dojkabacteria bacterium]